jgi:iron complex outermembrane receptor protein
MAMLCLFAPATRADAAQATARQAQPAAVIEGFIAGPDGARLPGVVVAATNSVTGSSQTVVTGDHGGYRLADLEPGQYELKAELNGFQPQIVRGLLLVAGQTRSVDFTLMLATYAELVTVIGANARDSLQASEIRDSAARDIGEALSHLNGVSKVRKGGIGNDIVVHGHHGRDLTVLIDGQQVYGACPNEMDPAVFHADFAEVDHIDLGKGPFDVVNPGSLGGVVNIVTRKPVEGVHGEANLSLGSFGYRNPSATASYGGRHVSLLGGLSYRSSRPYVDGGGIRFTEYANYRFPAAAGRAFGATTGWLRVFVSPRAAHTLQFSYARQQADHVLYPYLLMDATADDADRFRGGYEHAGNGRIETIAIDGFFTRVAHTMTDELRVSSATSMRPYSMKTQADSSVGGAKAQVRFAGTITGLDISRRGWNAATTMMANQFRDQSAIPDVATDSIGAYGSHAFAASAATTIDVGGRVDWARTTADPEKASTNLYFAYHGTRATSASDVMPSGHVRLTHRINERFRMTGGVGHTERVPDAQERYYGLTRMGADWVGNPALKPTGNTGLNADVDYQRGRIAVSVGVYREWLSNFVVVGPRARINTAAGIMNTRAQSYRGTDARMTSSEAKVTYSLSSRLFATAQASYTRGTKSAGDAGAMSTNLSEIPPLKGSLSARYDRVTMFVEAEVLVSASQQRVDSDLGEAPTPGYSVLNARVGHHFKALRITLNVDNLFDRSYLDYLSYQRDPFRSTVRVREPGRNVYLNASYRF